VSNAVSALRPPEGRHARQLLTTEGKVADSTGELTAVFLGRAHIASLEPGRRIRLHGKISIGAGGQPTMINPPTSCCPSQDRAI
jgi:hypothetical protein